MKTINNLSTSRRKEVHSAGHSVYRPRPAKMPFFYSFFIIPNQSSNILQHSQNRPHRRQMIQTLKYDNPDYKIKFDKSK